MTKERAATIAVYVSGGLAALLGLAVILGWYLHVPALFQFSPGMVPMQYNTALTHLVCGFALLTAQGRLRSLSAVCAFAAGAFAFCTGLQYVVGGDFGLDRLFIDPYVSSRTSHPGRMAPNTAVCFVLIAAALLFWHFTRNQARRIHAVTLCGVIVFLVGFTALTGYLIKMEAAYSWWGLSDMAPQTVVLFLILSVGILGLSYPGMRKERLEGGPSWTPVFVAIFGITLTLLVAQGILVTGQKRATEVARNEAQRKAYMIDRELADVAYLAKRMHDRWQMLESPLAGWKLDAANHLTQSPAYHSFAILNAAYEPYDIQSLDKDGQAVWVLPASAKEALSRVLAGGKAIAMTEGPVAGEWPLIFLVMPIEKNADQGSTDQGRGGFIAIAYSLETEMRRLEKVLGIPGLAFKIYGGETLLFSNGPEHTEEAWAVKSEAVMDFNAAGWKIKVEVSPANYQNSGLVFLAFAAGITLSLALAHAIRQWHNLESARKRMQDYQLRLETILDTAVDGLITIDERGFIQSYNKACERIFGYSAQEAIGANIKLLMPEEHATKHDDYVDNYKKTGVRKIIGVGRELEAVRKNGVKFPIDLSVAEVRLDGGRFFSGIIRDITERKAAEEELRVSNRELEQFAHVASHDLKAPLRGIDNLVKWVIEDAGPALPGETREKLELMRKRIGRLEALLGDILKYSRAGRIVGTSETIDMAELLEGIAKMGAWDDKYKIVIAPGMPTLQAPRTPLEQIFTNLVVNAIKHHDKDEGTVRIGFREAGVNYEFVVADDGPGIPAEFHDRVFQLFQTLQSRDKKEGSGLGLSIVKKLIEWQGGRVWIVSSGRGTEMHFLWPKVFKERKVKNAA